METGPAGESRAAHAAGTARAAQTTGTLRAAQAAGGLRAGLVSRDGRPDPAAVKDAFEAMLLSELLKPMERSLQASGLFPDGAPGEIYLHFWKSQMSDLLAQQIDLLPGWNPQADGGASGTPPSAGPLPLPAAAEPRSLTRGGEGLPLDRAAVLPLQRPAALAAAAPLVAPSTPATASTPAAASASATASAPAAASAAQPPAAFSAPETRTGQTLLARLAPFEPAIQDASRATGVGANWLRAVIVQESSARPDVVSPKGAIGLMQLLPATAAALGVADPFEPAANVLGGARYLGSLFTRYGDARLALGAYNAGPGRIERYGGVPPFRETRRYIDGVLALKRVFDGLRPQDAGL